MVARRGRLEMRPYRTFCAGFHFSDGNSELVGSSTGGCNIDMQTSPFLFEEKTTLVSFEFPPGFFFVAKTALLRKYSGATFLLKT
jgi:hypothetical protein